MILARSLSVLRAALSNIAIHAKCHFATPAATDRSYNIYADARARGRPRTKVRSRDCTIEEQEREQADREDA